MRAGKMVLTVVSQHEIASWEKQNGKGQTTLYECEALDDKGQVINEALRSFSELPLGQAAEYEVEAYSHPRHGDSWTLKKPRENTASRVTALEKTVQSLADRLSALESSRS